MLSSWFFIFRINGRGNICNGNRKVVKAIRIGLNELIYVEDQGNITFLKLKNKKTLFYNSKIWFGVKVD